MLNTLTKIIDTTAFTYIYDYSANSLVSLERKECAKHLGVLIDSKLSWTHHITYISTKISKSLGILERLRHFVPSSTLLNMYRSLVQPYLSYGIAWYSRLGPSSRLLPQIWRKFWFLKNVPLDWFISNPLGSTLYLCSNCLIFFLLIFFILKQSALLFTMYPIM